MKMPKYQTINYKAIESGVFAFEQKADKPNDTIPIPKMLRLEIPLKPCAAPLFLCDPFNKVKVNGYFAGKKITGLFETAKAGCYSGDIKESNDKKSTLLFQFSGYSEVDPFDAVYLKIYYYFYYTVSPKDINHLVYATFKDRQRKGYGF